MKPSEFFLWMGIYLMMAFHSIATAVLSNTVNQIRATITQQAQPATVQAERQP